MPIKIPNDLPASKILKEEKDYILFYKCPKEKEQFILLVATHMKKSYIQWNKDVEDHKIFLDLYDLSGHKIDIRNSNIKLPEMKDLGQRNTPNNSGGGKKSNQQKKK